ncbi:MULTISPECIES: protein kinase domain-containing protein [unclassified Streptomyces]|uniref:serine/threonine-protein kinase n=1 Tax=unclassified Streptomyces TaxID=2593676 RepID=UPI0007089B77|nr:MULTISPECIES: serine/threonine-protein kinase [unclassified Streptomyces]KRD18709.1 serine/threonine protein kinase [Streptomyces sp. Root264]
MTPQRNTGAGAEAELPEYAGHYRLEECLGAGGMGVVHLARSTSGMKVAVKVVHARFARDPEFRGRFRQEVAAARRVSGAFTAPVVDADPEAERPWMATLFIPGSTIAEQVKRNGPMNAGELRRLMAGLAEALRDIHRVGVVHRDLKPSNVLLAEDGPKVIDFGISRPKDSELRTETGKLIGTPPFMAPEQFRRPREVGSAADVFALGSVMVHAATGRGPFDSDSPYVVAYQVVHDEPDLTGVPDNLAPLVSRCLAKEPEDRPTPDELMHALRTVSASYDTQVFIPPQRALEEPEHGPATEARQPTGAVGTAGTGGEGGAAGAGGTDEAGTGGRSGGGGGAVSAGEREPGTGEDGRRRGRRRRAVLAAGALAVVLCGGALGAARMLGDGDADRGGRGNAGGAHSASPALADWSVRPVKGGDDAHGGTGGLPRCVYGARLLVCVQSGQVSALDASDGRVLWRRAVPGGGRSVEAPALAGGLALVVTDSGRRMEALDPASGVPRWQRDLTPYPGVRTVGGMLLLTAADDTVTGVDAATGRTAWSRRIPGLNEPYFVSFAQGARPLAYASNTSDGGRRTRITAVDPTTGEVRWEERFEGTVVPAGATGDSLVLLSEGSDYGDVDAVLRYRPGDAAPRRTALGVALQGVRATVQGDRVYLLAFDGSLVAVDTAARKELWSLQTAVSRGSAPAADGEHVYFGAADGRLLAVDADEGRLVGQTRLRLGAESDKVVASLPAPAAVDGRVYAGAPDGTVFAVDGRAPEDW